MKKQVRVITYCTEKSIGSVLQSFALTSTLSHCGYASTVCIEKKADTPRKKTRGRLKDSLIRLVRIPIKGKVETAHKKSRDFIAEHMEIEYLPDYRAFEKMAEEREQDVFLAGSDQIWNPDKADPVFFLSFVKNSKRVSYAASMGKTLIRPEKRESIKKWLSAFQYISVREAACIPALRDFTAQEIKVHIDPTFLIGPGDWREAEKPYPIKEPYILLYMLYWDPSCKEKIIALKKRTGLPVYAVCPDLSRVYADHRLFDVGVREFLWLVDHAAYVITSSFHGVALSIQFQKKFAAVINPLLPSRIEHLLDTLAVPKVDIAQLDQTEFDYDGVRERIEAEQQKGIAYLKEAIG